MSFLIDDACPGATQYLADVKDAAGVEVAGYPKTIPAEPDGSIRMDLSGFPVGKFTFIMCAADASGWWSDPAPPFTASKLAVVGGVRIVP